jgi:hypothetical protein
MRSTFRFAFVALAALALTTPASAQQGRPRLGIGVGISTFDFNLTTLATGFPASVPDSIYVPINLAPTFRIEPEVGAATLKQSSGSGVTSVETSVVSLGIGLFFLMPASPELDIYVGGRLVRTSFSSILKAPGSPDDKTEGADIRVSPAVGGEYSLHRRFSLGAEVQLQLISFGDRTVTGGGTVPGGSGLQTSGLFFARVYLL